MMETTIKEAWAKAQDIRRYKGALSDLELVDVGMDAYGDWKLYKDKDGNFWEEYFSIGD